MAQLTTRTTSAPGATAKGSPLTNAEVDQNFNRLNKAGPQIRPSLLLDFANSESVDNRITFSRASAATYYDANGVLQTVRDNKPRIDFDPVTGECKGLLIEEQRTNYMRRSSSFVGLGSGLGWHADGANIVVTQHAAIAPDGTMSAAKVERQNNGGAFNNWAQFAQNWSVGSGVPNANAWTFSLWLKSATGSTITVTMSISGVSVTTTSQNITVTTEWQRFSFSITAGTIGAGSSDIGGGFNLSLGHAVFVWGGQMEIGSFATSHIPSNPAFTSRASSATYFDSTGVLRIAGTNQPRYGFGYDTASGKWVSQGLVLEAAATNLLTMQSLFAASTSYWTINASTAPDGNSTATLLNNAVAPYNWYLTPFSVTSGSTYTFSIFAKAGSSTTFGCGFESGMGNFGIAYFTLSGNGVATPATGVVTASITPVGNGWYRCTVTGTAAASSVTLNVNAANAYAWGMQLEVGPVATSYIPTFGSTATRAADVSSSAATTRGADDIKMSGVNFSSWFNPKEGTILTQLMMPSATGQIRRVWDIANTSSGVYGAFIAFNGYSGGDTLIQFEVKDNSGTNNVIYTGSYASAVNHKAAVAYKLNQLGSSLNGGSVIEDTSAPIPTGLDTFYIGKHADNNWYTGYISKIAYYPKRLSNAELQALTQ